MIQAYLETHYIVQSEVPLTLQCGVHNLELGLLQIAFNTESSAFITAYNPFSHVEDEISNTGRQRKLVQDLQDQGLTYFEGIGQHPSGVWPGEPSFLVLDLSLEEATQLGIKYEQNAIIWCGSDAVPQLVLLR